MAKTEPQDYSAKRRKKRSKAKSQVSYSFVMLSLMLILACISGFVAFMFGQQALQGVNQIPLGGKLPRQAIPVDKPSDKPTPKTSKKANTSFFLHEDRKKIFLAQQDEIDTNATSRDSLINLVRSSYVNTDYANNLLANRVQLATTPHSNSDLNINQQVQQLDVNQKQSTVTGYVNISQSMVRY
jgi:hypothetical protein